MKTLEELGYHSIERNISVGYTKVVENRYTNFIRLWNDGEVSFGEGTFIDQETVKAIETEMKKRGWWK